MPDARERLAQSRKAILEHLAKRERRHDPREVPPRPGASAGEEQRREPPRPPRGSSWLARARYAARTWWRHHPAHMAVEVASPLLHAYGRSNPAKFIGFAALAGAALMFSRPWRLISITTLAVAVIKSSHLPSLLMSALSAADFEKDQEGPG